MSQASLPTTVAEFEQLAREALAPGPLAYFAGGAADEITLNANIAGWSGMTIHPRVMVDVSATDPSVSLLDNGLTHPILVAPTAYHALAHPRGEEATAAGAAAAESIYTLSTLATRRPAQVAKASPNGRKWFQIYRFKDRRVTDDLIAEAIDSGFEALVLTADLPVLGRRDRELTSGFTVGDASLIPGVQAANVSGHISMQDTADLIDPTLTWKDVEEIASASQLPLLVKGILRPDDARLALESGAAGIVVSNHGGRQLDTAPATAHVLQRIREELGSDATVLVDGGIRRGTDVVKALVLGADAVMVGRPVIWGLAAAGQSGVTAVLRILRDEFERALALCGCPDAGSLRGRIDLVPPSGFPPH